MLISLDLQRKEFMKLQHINWMEKIIGQSRMEPGSFITTNIIMISKLYSRNTLELGKVSCRLFQLRLQLIALMKFRKVHGSTTAMKNGMNGTKNSLWFLFGMENLNPWVSKYGIITMSNSRESRNLLYFQLF